MRGVGLRRLKNGKRDLVRSSPFSSKTLLNAEISAFSARKLLVNATKAVFLILFVDECLLQVSWFFLYSYSPFADAILFSFLSVMPLLVIVLFLFKVKLSASRSMILANVLGALVLAFNGWGFQPVIAWTTMFWAVIVLGHKFGINSPDRLYLAVFSILPLTVLWEVPWLLVHNSLPLEYFTLNGGSRLLVLPFLFLQLKILGWHFKRWMLLLSVAYAGWMLAYPYLPWQFDWVVRFPTVAFFVIVMFGGLRK